MVSGGLTGFGVAQDLLNIDFSPPEDAPEEFRAMAFNEKRVTTLRSGKSGRPQKLCEVRSVWGVLVAGNWGVVPACLLPQEGHECSSHQGL